MINGTKIELRPALLGERSLVYDMGMRSNVLQYSDDYNSTYQEFIDDYTESYFTGCFKPDCASVMICLENEPIGFISYGAICYGIAGFKPNIMELDIWMDGEKYCGKGFGTDAIITLSDYLNKQYGIITFFMVPNRKNLRAIRSYEKAGFIKIPQSEKRQTIKGLLDAEYFESLDKESEYLSDKGKLMIKRYIG